MLYNHHYKYYSYLVIISIIKSSLERRNVFSSHIQCLQKLVKHYQKHAKLTNHTDG